MSVVVAFDLETVADTDAGRRLYGFDGTDAEVAALMLARRLEESGGRSDFLNPPFHRVVGLGLAAITLNSQPALSLKSWVGGDERTLLAQFFDCLRRSPPLVSWNGSGFDLPVIRYRALQHGHDASALYGPADQRQWDSYGYRYGECHIDLMDVLAGYGASRAQSLDEVARLSGLPGKTVASGDQVLGLFLAGDFNTIARYVKSDAAQTLLLFLRWQLTRGRIHVTTYRDALYALRARLADDQAMVEAIERWLAGVPL